MKRVEEIFTRQQLRTIRRNTFTWKTLGLIELVINFIWKICTPFVPALVFSMLPNSNPIIVTILLLGGILKLLYSITDRTSIKESYLMFRWKVKNK